MFAQIVTDTYLHIFVQSHRISATEVGYLLLLCEKREGEGGEGIPGLNLWEYCKSVIHMLPSSAISLKHVFYQYHALNL